MTPQPPLQSTRVEAIDVLRGFTLFGIILVHMVEQYYAGATPQQFANSAATPVVDNIFSAIAGIFIMGKFYMIFSFLFGLSFFMQSSKRDSGFLLRFTWRLVILFGIGMLHHLHYRGDILSIYAILGFGLLLFSWLPDRALLIVAILLILNTPTVVVNIIAAINPPDKQESIFNQDQNILMTYYNTVKSGTYIEILKANLQDFETKMKFQVQSGRLYITLGLFFLGVLAGRKKIFENLELSKPFFKRAIRYSLWTLLATILVAVGVFGGAQVLQISLTDQVQMLVGSVAYDLFNATLSCVYASGILLLFMKEKWNRRLMVLYPVGRMGLTVYLMQSVFGTLIFFSYGLGLLYELGAATCFLLGIILFVVQIIIARQWFRYFQYGPAEWLWRSLTYLKIQPFRKTAVASVSVV